MRREGILEARQANHIAEGTLTSRAHLIGQRSVIVQVGRRQRSGSRADRGEPTAVAEIFFN